ncbi:hypothetical protein BDD12DRAFT_851370 [Trichophaea hybrida]|nr:hypothetical protein BDD12DRAFT_851370 [Trichophaea hybrida]
MNSNHKYISHQSIQVVSPTQYSKSSFIICLLGQQLPATPIRPLQLRQHFVQLILHPAVHRPFHFIHPPIQLPHHPIRLYHYILQAKHRSRKFCYLFVLRQSHHGIHIFLSYPLEFKLLLRCRTRFVHRLVRIDLAINSHIFRISRRCRFTFMFHL